MAEKSISVQKDIRIIVIPAEANVRVNGDDTIFDTELKIDGEKILQLISKRGIFKAETSLPVTYIKETKFSFDEEHIYYDDKACNLPPAQAVIAVALFKAYNSNDGPLATTALLKTLEDSHHTIGKGTFTRYLTEMRRTLRTATGATAHEFILSERNAGYRFDPIF